MFHSKLNIKHGNKSHLFWGIDKTTDAVVGIDDVAARGLNCNCRCAACGGDFIARKGDVNRHHFAHQSNYECVYANEIAIYMLAEKVLRESAQMSLPAISLTIGAHTEILKDVSRGTITDVYYHCDETQYPPLLIAEINQRLTRILLDFGGYYLYEDFVLLRDEAEAKKWDCLVIDMPLVGAEDFMQRSLLCATILENVQKKWIHTELKLYWYNRIQECLQTPGKMAVGTGQANECPLHKRAWEGQYYATVNDCEQCKYNWGSPYNCRCAANAGISQISDFSHSEEERQTRMQEQRARNEQAIQDKLRAEENVKQQAAEELKRRQELQRHIAEEKRKAEEAKRVAEEAYLNRQRAEIKKCNFQTEEMVFDERGGRWLKCEECGEIKHDNEFSLLGRRNRPAIGICTECVRKMN